MIDKGWIMEQERGIVLWQRDIVATKSRDMGTHREP
jgi:hypothetical protein